MEREEIEQVAEEFAQRRYINGCAVPTGNMISKSIACRGGIQIRCPVAAQPCLEWNTTAS